MKKMSVVLSIILLLSFVITACTPATPEPTEPPVEPTEEVVEPTDEVTEEPAAPAFDGVNVQFWHVYFRCSR